MNDLSLDPITGSAGLREQDGGAGEGAAGDLSADTGEAVGGLLERQLERALVGQQVAEPDPLPFHGRLRIGAERIAVPDPSGGVNPRAFAQPPGAAQRSLRQADDAGKRPEVRRREDLEVHGFVPKIQGRGTAHVAPADHEDQRIHRERVRTFRALVHRGDIGEVHRSAAIGELTALEAALHAARGLRAGRVLERRPARRRKGGEREPLQDSRPVQAEGAQSRKQRERIERRGALPLHATRREPGRVSLQRSPLQLAAHDGGEIPDPDGGGRGLRLARGVFDPRAGHVEIFNPALHAGRRARIDGRAVPLSAGGRRRLLSAAGAAETGTRHAMPEGHFPDPRVAGLTPEQKVEADAQFLGLDERRSHDALAVELHVMSHHAAAKVEGKPPEVAEVVPAVERGDDPPRRETRKTERRKPQHGHSKDGRQSRKNGPQDDPGGAGRARPAPRGRSAGNLAHGGGATTRPRASAAAVSLEMTNTTSWPCTRA